MPIEGTHVIALKVEGFLRLEAIELGFSPESGIVQITGKNKQGKSSVVKSMVYLLSGGKIKPDDPVYKGMDKAKLSVTLDDKTEIVISCPKDGKQTLTITNANKAKYSSPQALLKKLIGPSSFDLRTFSQENSKTAEGRRKQVELLLQAIGKRDELFEIEQKQSQIDEQRKLINADLRSLNARVAKLPTPDEETDPELKSADSIFDRMQQAEKKNESNKRIRDEKSSAYDKMIELGEDVTSDEAKVSNLEIALKEARDSLIQVKGYAEDASEYYEMISAEANGLADDIPIDPIREELKNINALNEPIRQKIEYLKLVAEVESVDKNSKEHTAKIRKLNDDKARLLTDENSPVKGLTLDPDGDGLLYKRIRLQSIAESESVLIGLELVVKQDPQIKTIFIERGESLDSETMAGIDAFCKENNIQCIVERVDETGKVGIVIEAGAVKADNRVESSELKFKD
jgi:hypothetical protein